MSQESLQLTEQKLGRVAPMLHVGQGTHSFVASGYVYCLHLQAWRELGASLQVEGGEPESLVHAIGGLHRRLTSAEMQCKVPSWALNAVTVGANLSC